MINDCRSFGFGNHLRKSSNGKKAVSKTVNVGSIPAFRACYKNSFRLTSAHAEARCLAQNEIVNY